MLQPGIVQKLSRSGLAVKEIRTRNLHERSALHPTRRPGFTRTIFTLSTFVLLNAYAATRNSQPNLHQSWSLATRERKGGEAEGSRQETGIPILPRFRLRLWGFLIAVARIGQRPGKPDSRAAVWRLARRAIHPGVRRSRSPPSDNLKPWGQRRL